MLKLLEGEESAPIYGQSTIGLECKQSPVLLSFSIAWIVLGILSFGPLSFRLLS